MSIDSVDTAEVVVGVDGSRNATAAVRWAADVAARRRLRLRIVYGLRVPELYYGGGLAGSQSLLDTVRDNGERILREAADVAMAIGGEMTVTVDMPIEPAVPLLTDLSRTARVTVVGGTGIGGFAGMLAGSTAAGVVSHAHGPVAVVRERPDSAGPPADGPVVVGVDGSPVGERALQVAFEEASLRGAVLVAVHAWQDVDFDEAYGAAGPVDEWESAAQGEHRLLAQRLAGWQEKYPDVEIRREVVRDRPRHSLLDWSQRARLVVVGSHGRGGFRGMLLGSVSQALVSHARCPVMVVRPAAE
jgi:nucleotide-binding universal stress UspA family protein